MVPEKILDEVDDEHQANRIKKLDELILDDIEAEEEKERDLPFENRVPEPETKVKAFLKKNANNDSVLKLKLLVDEYVDKYNKTRDPKKKKQLDNIMTGMIDKADKADKPELKQYWTRVVLSLIADKDTKNVIEPNLLKKVNLSILDHLKHRFHYVDGYFKLLEWALQQSKTADNLILENFKRSLLVAVPERTPRYKQILDKTYKTLVYDNAIFNYLTKASEEHRDHNHELHSYFHMKGHSSFEETLDELLNSYELVDNYHSYVFFLDILKMFNLFEDKLGTGSILDKTKYVEVFMNLYKFILEARLTLKDSRDYPVNYALFRLSVCLTQTEKPNHKATNNMCTMDYKDYAEIWWFLKYYQAIERMDNSKFFENQILTSPRDDTPRRPMFIVESHAFVYYMTNAETNDLLQMNDICEGHMDEQICVEYTLFKKILEAVKSNTFDFENLITTL